MNPYSRILPVLIALWRPRDSTDTDYGILRFSSTRFYRGPVEPFEDELGRRHWEPVAPCEGQPHRFTDSLTTACVRMVMDYGLDIAEGTARAEEWNVDNAARTGALEAKDEDALDAFRDHLRKSVTEHLDTVIVTLFDGDEAAAKARMGQGGVGCIDADLHYLFPAIDRQARLLWERGMRAQWTAMKTHT